MMKLLALAALSLVLGYTSAATASATKDCPPGGDGSAYFAGTDLCYTVYKTKTSWSAAQGACSAASAGAGGLAMLKTAAINTHVHNLIKSIPGVAHTWFGLNRATTSSPFEWVDGSTLASTGFTTFNPGEDTNRPKKDDRCNYIQRGNSDWYTRECDDSAHYVCEGPPVPPTPPVQPVAPVAPSVDQPTATGGGVTATGGGVTGSVAADPHLVLQLVGNPTPICFDIHGKTGETYQLIYDPEAELSVNADILQIKTGSSKSWFKALGINTPDCVIKAVNDVVYVNRNMVSWSSGSEPESCGTSVTYWFVDETHLAIETGNGVHMTVHKVHGDKKNINYMDFLLDNHGNLSPMSHGLLGQFQSVSVSVQTLRMNKGLLTFQNDPYREGAVVTPKSRYSLVLKERISCWFVENEGQGVIDGTQADYLIDDIEDNGLAPGLQQFVEFAGDQDESVDAIF